jgi:peptidoglycan/xylan/chitin deacetylase (PgdA/CDA1 family)
MKMPFSNISSGGLFVATVMFLSLSSCRHTGSPGETLPEKVVVGSDGKHTDISGGKARDTATVEEILSRNEIPVLCYHRLLEQPAGGRPTDNIISADVFRAEMQMLADSGYHTILPDQLYDHLVFGDALPENPVMITFDDGSVGHYEVAVPALEKHGFRGVFFIMTIATGKPGYLSREQIREMSDRGHIIASHTREHKSILKYDTAYQRAELAGPRSTLESITGKPVVHFAYPYGLWERRAVTRVKEAGYRTAFILSTKRDDADPLYTIRRMNVPGYWHPAGMLQAMKRTFAGHPVAGRVSSRNRPSDAGR